MYVLSNLFTYGTIIISAIASILFMLYVIGSVFVAATIYFKVGKSYMAYRKEMKLTEQNDLVLG